ncbi:MAG TPA: S1C family serine protease [Chloroflexota bacterium]|nr:S1C family serine protease [Chloroflexota bacterium]
MRYRKRGSLNHVRSRLIGFFFCLILLVKLTTPAYAADGFVTLPDFPIPNGHFYSQASGHGVTAGFTITNDGGANFYSEFTRLGTVDRLGYPASRRFMSGGFLTQATQKALLQWHPEIGKIQLANVFDEFTQLGLDPTLDNTYEIPPTGDNTVDRSLTWSQVVSRHLALLNQNPAIRARYFADPDPIDDFGLPQAAAAYGNVFVIRCERAAFQQWTAATSFARSGEVTVVNAGDLAKQLGLVPAVAVDPEAATQQLVAPLGATLTVSGPTQASVKASVAKALPSLVRIDVALPDGAGLASGIVLDQNGDILTNDHVVNNALTINVTFVNGKVLPAHIVGTDPNNDLAVIRVSPQSIGSGVNSATFTAINRLEPGQFVAAIGFSPFFPMPPAVRIGVFQRLDPTQPPVLLSNIYILPGDSGGMLLDMSGNVIAINDEIRFTHQQQEPLIGFSIDAATAERIAQQLAHGGS